jgi:hypothetical protein
MASANWEKIILSFFVIFLIFISGCPNNSTILFNDPTVGTWNGYAAKVDGQSNIFVTAIVGDDVSKIILNVYNDGSFEYVINNVIVQGKMVSTGKGNYIIKSTDNEAIKRYFRYNDANDFLILEMSGFSIEFRRNDKIWTKQEFTNYANNLIRENNEKLQSETRHITQSTTTYSTQSPTSVPTPIPTISPKYKVGDIIADGQSIIIIDYNSWTDRYQYDKIFKNNDGSWGYRLYPDYHWEARLTIERNYPYLQAHLDPSKIITKFHDKESYQNWMDQIGHL